ncbi:hybrid sensor histidine kinase/response regulator transcription factor [Ancylomarina sp. 16SWW S1-10-2]|uniref:hybrid sensor histidine kinase/response regulator transcription factor n=1 Tax=Ancylomarina sp. 16SWW S1-10-2 TaxID=2499681 RepID=UPI0012AE3DC2|nr:hybrid sensor histidine kinase/response regulator transcription factor [Ancylomarina sp. 16SWW S1-10-2]MRT93036.1 response regulator [Ancylomarina sp. 16SWW S1-10-2]
MDSRGFNWFGTWDGLNRFDGSNIKVFKPNIFQKGSINNNIIRKILEDKSRNLWIVTEKGLNQYDPYKENFTPYLDTINNNIYIENSFHATLSLDSVLWCSVYNWGITHFDQNNKKFVTPIKLPLQPNLLRNILGLSFSSDSTLWVMKENGSVLGLKKNSAWKVVKEYTLSSKYEILPKKHWFVKDGASHYLFVAMAKGGILKVNLDKEEYTSIHSGDINMNVTTISKGLEKGVIWGGTDSGRLFKIINSPNIEVYFFEDQLHALSNKQVKIWSITETNPDLLWIGTDGDGVHKYDTRGNSFISTQKGDLTKGKINHNIVRAIHEDDKGNIWIGTRGNGLNCIPAEGAPTKIFNTKNGLSNNAVLSLGSDSDGNIWVGVDGEGIDMIETSTNKILHFPRNFINKPQIEFGSVYSICKDAFGDMWIGTSGYGLFRFTVTKKENGKYLLLNHKHYHNDPSKKQGLQSDIVYAIVEGRPNVLWIGTREGGLYRLNTLTDKFEVFKSNSQLSNTLNNDDVLSLWKSSNQELWIGTSGGLNRLNMSTSPYSFSHYTEQDGIPNNTIHAILEDSLKNIWVSTNKGLSKLNKETGEIRNYFQSDGLQNNEYSDGASCMGQTTGLLYFGGVNGFDKFNSYKITDSPYFPRLAITNFKNTTGATTNLSWHIDLCDTLRLKHNQNFFQFQFTTLNYHNKQKCKYAYKLENFNENFINTEGEEKAIFTNVPPGEYVFKVKCTNEDGIWNPQLREIHILISPPFWKTSWAYLLYFLFICLIFVSVIYAILRRAGIQNQLAMEQLKVQKTKEMNQCKLQFFTNIAHEFRTPLTLIMAPAAQLMEFHGNDPKVGLYAKTIYNNSKRLHQLIRELIDFRKVETGHLDLKIREGNLTTLTSTIVNAFTQYAEQNNVQLSIEPSNQETMGWFDNGIIEKILLNLISNAIKFTPAGGSVSIALNKKGKNAHINVTDTGIGISDDVREKIFNRFFHHSDELPNLKDAPEGSGVGLALTKSLVERHHGSIQLKSKPGEGSCFSLIIPLAKESYKISERQINMVIDESLIRKKADDEFRGINPVSLDNKFNQLKIDKQCEHTILIVDDNAQLRSLVYDILSNKYTIKQAANGLEALNIIKYENISLVISDIIMPVMDGLKLCQTIKNDINTCHIPVILLTAKGNLENRIEGIEVGADSYIPKPFEPRHLKIRIKKLIATRIQIQDILKTEPEKPIENLEGLNNRDIEFLSKLQKFVNENLDQSDLDAEQMSDILAMSKTQLYRKVKAVTGFTPHGYIKHYRLKKAARLLKETSMTVSEVIYETGFNNRTYFYRSFKEVFGISPGNYSKKNNRPTI